MVEHKYVSLALQLGVMCCPSISCGIIQVLLNSGLMSAIDRVTTASHNDV